jgi:integrase
LSPRTVRYIATIVHKVLAHAVRDGLLLKNPADAATPPSAREAKPPEMHPWAEAQLAAFLSWARDNSQSYALWHTLAYTSARRGEMLALRWLDADLDTGTVTIRRSAGMVRNAGEGAAVVEGLTKSGKPRVVRLDDDAIAMLRAHKIERGKMALQLARPDALVFGDIEGGHRNPEHTSRQFIRDIERCQAVLGAAAVPMCRLHDLRHCHATVQFSPRACRCTWLAAGSATAPRSSP